jgi:hypothetical protein
MPSDRTITYGTKTSFASSSNLNSLANGAAKPLGALDNTTTKADRYLLQIAVVLASASVSATGTIEWWLIQAPVNSGPTDWTDGIDPGSASDIASSLRNAILIRVSTANANNLTVRERFQLPVSTPHPFFAIVAVNKTGAAFASSGHLAEYISVKDNFS